MSHAILVGSANPILFFRAFDTDGTAKVNLLAAEAGLSLSVYRTGGSSVAISSLSDKAADNTAHADGAIRQVGSGNLYTIDAPDAAVASQFAKSGRLDSCNQTMRAAPLASRTIHSCGRPL